MPPVRRPGTDPEAEHPEYAGQYRLEGRLGSGGMGVVHLSHSTSGLRLAVKVVHEEFAKDPEFRARFRQEVAAARLVSGAFTAPVVDADPGAERPWMATLYIPGPTLAEFVKRNGPVAPAQVRYLMTGLAEALRDIHRAGVVHRDLKPSNVLLAADGPKVIDFGISRPSDSDLRTETGKLIGTPPFMAPEQFKRPREVGPAADVFAMASVLVHAATGRSPFDSDSPYIVAYQVVHDEPHLDGLPGDLRPLIERCLAKDPDDRPTPDALMAELRKVSASYDTQTFGSFDLDGDLADALIPTQRRSVDGAMSRKVPRPGSASGPDAAGPAPVASTSRRRRARSALVAFLALGILAAGAFLLAQRPDDTTPLGSTGSPVTTGGDFHPWQTVLRENGGTGTAACAAGGGALFCAGPGVEASKLDADSGLTQWSVRVKGGTRAHPHPPVLSGGVVRVVSDDESRLNGLSAATGRVLWTFDISAYQGAFSSAGTTVLLAGRDGAVVAVDGTTGREKWRVDLPGHHQPALASYGASGRAYAVEVEADGRHTLVTTVDESDGTVQQQVRLDGQLSPVGESGADLFLTSVDSYHRTDAVVRLNAVAGSHRRIAIALMLSEPQTAVLGGMVYLLDRGGELIGLDTRRSTDRTATEPWRLETSVSGGSVPTVVGDRLYFTAVDGRLLAVDAERGIFLGQTKPRLGTRPGSYPGAPPSPLVADGKVFATAPDGSVFAVDAEDPSRW
ncbi:serine/threonine-protein kinase [Actinacidiphila glaucinigra]|uniref:serine/threonine-protein kinase n=1 Tax=Actinacidiphila glaucinigra TaxID=235986 RepID=UPI0036EE962F